MRVATISLAGTGLCLPASCLESDAIDLAAGRPAGWLSGRCGVHRRYVCHDETQEAMAARACRDGLDQAGLSPDDVDLVIFASSVGRQPIPATAPLIAGLIGIGNGRCAAFDVNATCLGFLTGVDVAAALIETGRYTTALVVSSEVASRALPWRTAPDTAGLFGDGAAAAVIVKADTGATLIVASRFESHPDGYAFCQLKSGGTAIDPARDPEAFEAGRLFEMDGRRLYKLTAERFPAFVDRLLAAAGWTRADVDLVVPHQASVLALRHLVERCGFPADRVVDIVASHGNQVAASLPTALHLARAEGRARAGSRVLMLGTSAGVSFGGLALRL